MSTTPGSSSASRFHSWKCSHLLVMRADLRLLAVAEHYHRVMVEDVGDGVAVVRVVLLKGGLEVPVDVLALDEEQRQAVDEADDVGPAAVEVPFDPQLAHAQEVIVLRCLEVEDP